VKVSFRAKRGISFRTRSLVALLLGMTQAAYAATYPLPAPDQDLVGEIAHDVAAEEDALVDIARRHGLGYEELTATRN
jgi:L,D-transpeptidase ErfK/SrfK